MFNMPLVIPDETLTQMNLDEREARIEIACRLFDAGKLTLFQAGKMAGLGRIEFEAALRLRGIAPYRIDEEYLRLEKLALDKWESGR